MSLHESDASGKSGNGVLYVIWPGAHGSEKFLDRSMESVKRFHPELPIHVERLGRDATLLDKARMYDFSPFVRTLYLDADTVLLSRVDAGFSYCARTFLACCINECPWASRYRGLADQPDLIEYNTGVMFFDNVAKRVFDRWKLEVRDLDSSCQFVSGNGVETMPENDQAAFAKVFASEHLVPAVLPMNWNFRPKWHKSWFGPIKIWHDYEDPPQSLLDWNESQTKENAVIQSAASDWKFAGRAA